MKKKLITLIIALLLLITIVHAQEQSILDLINKHILREANSDGITKQCEPEETMFKECGWCGIRTKECTSQGIWPLGWSSCEGEGYCNPEKEVPDVLKIDTHRKYDKVKDTRFVDESEPPIILNGRTYDVYVVIIKSGQTKFNVNNEITPYLKEGNSYILSDGTYIGVSEISKGETWAEFYLEGLCQNNQVEYVKTYQKKDCGDDCSYTNVIEEDEHVSWECNSGYCGATCTATTNEVCGRCGTSICINCIETCNETVNACTPGTKRISICSDCNQIKYEKCGNNCQWELERECGTPITEPGCEKAEDVGKTKTCGYCGAQTCSVTCAQGEIPHYYWSSCTGEYNGNDKCLPGQQTEKLKQTKRESCDETLVKYSDVYQNKLCPNTCKLNEGTWTGAETLKNEIKVSIKGKCGYDCSNGETDISGKGRCEQIKTCQNNKWVITKEAGTAITEVCENKLDDDCDGQVDEGCYIPPEVCDDGIDNDQDRKTDCADSDCNGQSCDVNKICASGTCVTSVSVCEGCSCGGNPNLDFKSFYEFNYHVCKPDSKYNANADFNGDGCVGVAEYAKIAITTNDRNKYLKSFGGGFRNIGGIYKYYPNPDFDCFYEKYTQTCTGCPDLNSDGEIDISDITKLTDKYGECNIAPELDLDGDGCIYNIRGGIYAQNEIGDISCVAKYYGMKASNIDACKVAKPAPTKKANNEACISNDECQSGNCLSNNWGTSGGIQKACCADPAACVDQNGRCVNPSNENAAGTHYCMPGVGYGWLAKCRAPNFCAKIQLTNSRLFNDLGYIPSCLIDGVATANNCFVCNEGYIWGENKETCVRRYNHHGYIWYAGDYGESCETVCGDRGVNPDITWNDDSSCSVMKELLGGCPTGCRGIYADGRLPSKQDDGWCFYRKDAANDGVNVMPGIVPKSNPIKQRSRRICACNN